MKLDPDRLVRALSLAFATVCWKGQPDDADGIQALSDEFVEYIEGGKVPTIPLPDKASRGRLPKP